MRKKEEKLNETARIFEKEFQWSEKGKNIIDHPPLSTEVLLTEYNTLYQEYSKLLKKTIKITHIGDSNQRKLLMANERVQIQKEELIAAYKKMELLARTDPLTNLSNRRDFLDKFQEEIFRFERSGKPFTVVLGDLDDFKLINDRCGHDCGDYILVSISRILRSMVRKQDIVSRWGGEEFILLLPEAPLTGGKKVAETIRKRIAGESFLFADKKISITISLGVSEFEKNMNIDRCIKKADEALYEGKQKGKNCVGIAKLDHSKKEGIS